MKRFLYAILALSTLVSCNNPTTIDKPQAISLDGYAQKGQLIKGSQITAYALDTSLVATGESFPATIADDMGAFAINGKSTAQYLELNAQGYYFNENRGELSESPIYLTALVRTDAEAVNLNLLTTLTTPRIKRLITNGLTYTEAAQQAESELLDAFGYSSDHRFTEMNISGASEADGLLLAASCLIQEGLSTAETQALITEIASSLATSGKIDEATIEELMAKADDIEKLQVAENLIEYYSEKGIDNYSIPPFYYYLDPSLREGFHFIDREPISIVLPGTPDTDNDANTPKEGCTVTKHIICDEPFTAESNQEWISAEVTTFAQNIYTLEYTVEPNGGEKREGKIVCKSQSGNTLHEIIIIQNNGLFKLYIEGPDNGTRTTIEDSPRELCEGEMVGVNGKECELKRDEYGLYVALTAPAEVYRVVWPTTAEDNNGDSFTPIEPWAKDYYYCTVRYPETGYQAGVFPYYGLLVGNYSAMQKVTLRPMFAGVRVEVRDTEVVDNSVTISAEAPIFGTFTYSNYLDEQELMLNPNAVMRDPIVENGKESTKATLRADDNGNLTTPLLLIPAQNYNFRYFDRQITELRIEFDYVVDGRVEDFSTTIPANDFLNEEGNILKIILKRANNTWTANLTLLKAN